MSWISDHPGTVDLTVVIPAKDEDQTIGKVLKDLQRTLSAPTGYKAEVIVVDDHSCDRTAILARELGALVLTNDRAAGKGGALACGFAKARGRYILMMDADYSHRPEEIPAFLELLNGGFGLVVASRQTGWSDEYTLVRGSGNIFLTLFFWLVSGHLISDALNGFKGFRHELVEGPPLKSRGFEIEIELLIRALYRGYRIGEFSSHERERAGGRMKSSAIRHGLRFFWSILKWGIPWRLRLLRRQMRIGRRGT